MTTTLNIPDQLLKQAQTEAAQHGLSLQDFVTGILQDRLTPKGEALRESLPWREFFGSMRHLHAEREKIEALIQEEFEQVDAARWT